MSTRLLRNITLCGSGVMLCLLAAMLLPMASSAQPSDTSAETAGALAPLAPDDTPAPEPSPEATPAAPPDPGVAIPEAENHLRKGVELYNQNLFLEALSEFNRALALDPTMENAKLFQEKCNGKLQMGAIGGDPAAIPTFETLDPASIAESAETPQLSAGEMKIQRVRELLKLADLYLENERYSTAGSIYEEIMLIAPDNTRARAGLHKATIGASKQDMKEAEAEVAEDRWKTKRYIERSKGLPEGADATGIKQYRISVPKIDEEYMPPRDKTEIEKTLDSPVSLIFEDIHLREIVDFISESYDTNVVVDDRVVMPPAPPAPAATGRPAAALPGAPGAYPMMPGATGGRGMPGAARPYPGSPAATNMPAAYRPQQQAGFGTQGANQGGGMLQGEYVTDGIIRYVYIKNVTLREGLKALLRPLKLDFSVQPSFIWISTPDNLRHESFEELETRYYELRNAGAETLFKIVLRNPGGSSGGGGGYGGGGGGYGGGRGGGGYGGGGIGGGGYGGGGIGGGGYGGGGGGYGGGGYGGGGIGLGGGGYGGGGGGYGGGRGGGGYGGGGIGGGGGVTIQNISQLFGSINDSMVGETPAIVGTSGISGATTTPGGVTTGVGAGGYGAGTQGAYGAGTQAAGLGGTRGRAMNVAGDEPEIVRLLRLLIDDVYEPSGTEPISRMVYVPLINKLMVHNTPTNLAKLEKQLVELDVTPKQVSIEAKFITVKTNDLKKTGFKWDISRSDQNSRDQAIPGLEETTYLYDINGDGILESIPFYTRPGGSNVITNTITSALMSSVTSPGPDSSFSISGIITDNEDGDRLSMVFDYLDSLDETELLSAPRVTTMNRKPAVIVDLTTEWYTSMVDSQIVTSGGGFAGGSSIGSITREQPSQFNYGITLSVTPQISGGDQVRLWLNPQVTTRGGDSEFITRTNINGEESELKYKLPNTFTQAVWTNVIVHDGDTLVLGGLVDDRTSRGSEKTPYLADIPVLGFFFKGKSRETRQSSLLIFVTPTIIDTTGSRFFEVGGSSFQPYGVMPKEDKAPEMAPDTFSVDPSAWAPEPSPVEEVPAESVAETEDAI